MTPEFSLLLLVFWALLSGFIAVKKGRNFFLYFGLTFIITPIATIVLLLFLSKKDPKQPEQEHIHNRDLDYVPQTRSKEEDLSQMYHLPQSPAAVSDQIKSGDVECAFGEPCRICKTEIESSQEATDCAESTPTIIGEADTQTHEANASSIPAYTDPLSKQSPETEVSTEEATRSTCENCGKELFREAVFCPFCGQKVTSPIGSAQEGIEPPKTTDSSKQAKVYSPLDAPTQESKTTAKWLAVIAFLVIAVIIACVFLLAKDWDIGEPDTPQNTISDLTDADPDTTTQEAETLTPLSTAADSVLYLETYDENGEVIASASGFLVNDNRTLVTNYHVIQDAYRVVAQTADGNESIEANTLLAYNETADLAVLRCDSAFDRTVLALDDSTLVKQGDTTYAIGYPLGLANTMSNGIISARYIDEYGVDMIQTTAAISEGNSGGPLLNEDGQVIGIICAYYVHGQNLNLAVASNTLRDLLNSASGSLLLSDWANRPAMPGQELVEEDSEMPDTETAPEGTPHQGNDTPPAKTPDVPPPAATPEKTVEIELNHSTYYLKPNETLTLIATDRATGEVVDDVSWSFLGSDGIYIAVDGGVVTPTSGYGRAAIVATTKDGQTAICEIMEDKTYSGLTTNVNGTTRYSKFPSLLSVENIIPSAHYWTEYEVSYPQFGIWSYYYAYQTATLDEAEACAEKYARFLQENGYTLIREEDNPLIRQDRGADIIYELESPDGLYIISITSDYSYMYKYNAINHYLTTFEVDISYK